MARKGSDDGSIREYSKTKSFRSGSRRMKYGTAFFLFRLTSFTSDGDRIVPKTTETQTLLPKEQHDEIDRQKSLIVPHRYARRHTFRREEM